MRTCREITSIHIGQGGCQIGERNWELYSLEHGVGFDGYPTSNQAHTEVMYGSTQSGKVVPRALFVDLEPSVVDEINNGRMGSLFAPRCFINGKEDAANNFARGYFTTGKDLFDKVSEELRKIVEPCDGLQGFFISASVGGGTGSGFEALLSDSLQQSYSKVPIVNFSVFPSPHLSTSVVEPYNSVLSSNQLIEQSDITLLLDNEGIYRIVRKLLGIPRPTYLNLNRIISRVCSDMTCSLRFAGSLNVDLNEFQTNLVPYPRLHFMLSSYAPVCNISTSTHQRFDEANLVREAYDKNNWLAMCDPSFGKYMASCMLFRGNCIHQKVNKASAELKNNGKIQFVEWCPTGIKVGMNSEAPVAVPDDDLICADKSLSVISNTTAIHDIFTRISSKFDIMYSKRAFVHWFVGEGMEEGEFADARESLEILEKDYLDVCRESDNENSDDDYEF